MHPLVELEDKARNLADNGEPEKSVETYKELLRLSPNWEHGLGCYELAYTLEQLGRDDEALPYYHQAIMQRSHDSYFWYGYANLAARHGDAQEALKYLQQILAENPGGGCWKNIGELLARAGLRAGKTQEDLLITLKGLHTEPKVIDSFLANWCK